MTGVQKYLLDEFCILLQEGCGQAGMVDMLFCQPRRGKSFLPPPHPGSDPEPQVLFLEILFTSQQNSIKFLDSGTVVGCN